MNKEEAQKLLNTKAENEGDEMTEVVLEVEANATVVIELPKRLYKITTEEQLKYLAKLRLENSADNVEVKHCKIFETGECNNDCD